MKNWIETKHTRRTAVLIAAFCLSSCSSIGGADVTPAVRVMDFNLVPRDDGGRDFIVALEVDNLGAEPIRLSGIEFTVRVGGEGFLQGVVAEPVIVPALDRVRVRARTSSEFISSVSRLITYLQGPESTLEYSIEGVLHTASRPPRQMRFDGMGRAPLMMSAGG
jgi:LEA14-like dessication related protein